MKKSILISSLIVPISGVISLTTYFLLSGVSDKPVVTQEDGEVEGKETQEGIDQNSQEETQPSQPQLVKQERKRWKKYVSDYDKELERKYPGVKWNQQKYLDRKGFDVWDDTIRNPISKEEADKVIRKLDDYTLRLDGRCSGGTAWILDYMKSDEQFYPTKWFIATNAHVADKFKYDGNKFEQTIFKNEKCEQTGFWVEKEISDPNKDLSEFKYLGNWNTYKDFNERPNYERTLISDQEKGIKKEFASYFIHRPKLLFFADNFLKDTGIKENYFKDFAIIEINFTNQDIARWVTDDFYSKYKPDGDNAIDVMAKEIYKRKSLEEIRNNEDNYFIVGYPINNSFDGERSVSNYNPISQTASKMSYWESTPNDMRTEKGSQDALRGHTDLLRFDSTGLFGFWMRLGRNVAHRRIGYGYILDGSTMGGGASGSLAIDQYGNALGVLNITNYNMSMIEPLRSDGLDIEEGDNKYYYPKFDFIIGAEGQKTSYKEQIDKHYPQYTSFLRQKYKWEVGKRPVI